MEFLFVCTIFLPGLCAALLGLGWLLGWQPRERTIARLTMACYALATLAVIGLWIGLMRSPQKSLTVALGDWFTVAEYRFPLVLLLDRLSLPLIALSVVLVGIISKFSIRYMHRDPGVLRFFVLLHLFGFGILLLFAAGSFDLLIGGWEIVGITSVLLIAYFQTREAPVQNALRVFAIYRTCDIGLLTAVVVMHHYTHTTAFSELFAAATWPYETSILPAAAATLVGALLLFAAMGKAAQVPFSSWLPRAMEGPTPSSAIFYGALSVHAGAYLLLRAQPIIAQSTGVSLAIVLIGWLTALHGAQVGRACADAKTTLAYAALTQLGIIFVEIGIGWHWLALLHICGHAVVRTLQFLRAPSMLHEHHTLYAASGGRLKARGVYVEQLLPGDVRHWLYRLAFDRSHLGTALERFGVAPLEALARTLHKLESFWLGVVRNPKLTPRTLNQSINKTGNITKEARNA